MKLSPTQRDVLEKMRDGWEMRITTTASGRVDYVWLRQPVSVSREKYVIAIRTYEALRRMGAFGVYTPLDYMTSIISLSDAGRKLLEGSTDGPTEVQRG